MYQQQDAHECWSAMVTNLSQTLKFPDSPPVASSAEVHDPPLSLSLYQDTSINRTLSSVSNVTFVYLTTSEMRTPHYSGHFNLSQYCPD